MNANLEGLSLAVTVFSGHEVVVFGWIGAEDNSSALFVNSLQRLPANRLADAVVRIAFHQSDNIFLRESWWGALSDIDKERLPEGIQLGVRRKDEFVDCGTINPTTAVVEVASF